MAKRKLKTVTAFDPENPTILRFEWTDKSKTVFDLATLPEDIAARTLWHGANSKIGDAGAGSKTVAEHKAASWDVFEMLVEGDWTRSAGGRDSRYLPAIAAVYKVSLDDAREAWKRLDDGEKDAVSKEPAILDWLHQRALERAKAAESKVDVAKLFTKAETETE